MLRIYHYYYCDFHYLQSIGVLRQAMLFPI
jgi:hypothetical protein